MGGDKNDTPMTARRQYRHEKGVIGSPPPANQDHLPGAGRIMMRAQKLLSDFL
jgi:hypothetical protein